MQILNRKSTLERLLDSIEYEPIVKSVARSAVDSALLGPDPAIKLSHRNGGDLGRQVSRAAAPLKKARKPGLILAATAAGITAISAGVSSGRRRSET
jgi:hypothetical protein